MEVDIWLPKGPVRSNSRSGSELMNHAMSEATRLGITLNFTTTEVGLVQRALDYTRFSMQVIVWSETIVEGAEDGQRQLAEPKTTLGYYNDIAVVVHPSGDGMRIMGPAIPR